MTDLLQVKHFYKVLKKNRCLIQFIENTVNEHPEIKGKPILTILERYPSVGIGFIWLHTREGATFWNEIDKKWIKYWHEINC